MTATMPKLELPTVPRNETPDVCGPCGGECCKQLPGLYHPAQFGADLAGVYELLKSGRAAIDNWDGGEVYYTDDDGQRVTVDLEHSPAYYLRPAVKPHWQKQPSGIASWLFAAAAGSGGVFDQTWGGECVNLTDSGCSLSWDDRPVNCRGLVAKDGGRNCKTPAEFDKPALVVAWQPFALALGEIGRRVKRELDGDSDEA